MTAPSDTPRQTAALIRPRDPAHVIHIYSNGRSIRTQAFTPPAAREGVVMAHPLDSDRVTEIERLAREGVTAYRIAKTVGVSPRTVLKYAPPGSFNRTTTEAATKAHRIDAGSRRALQRQRYLDIVDDAQARALTEYEHAALGGVDGEVRRWTTSRPPARELADLVRAAATASQAEQRLADRDDGGLSHSISLLDALIDRSGRDTP